MYTQEDIRKVQLRLLKMATVIRDILEANHIRYFITYGTLLGAVRHQGFVPWDDDFDFYLFDDEYDSAMTVLRKELPDDMFLESWDSEPLYYHDWAHVKDLGTVADYELFPGDGSYAHKGINIDLYRTRMIFEAEEQVYRLTKHHDYLIRRHSVNLIDDETFRNRMEEVNFKLKREKDLLNETSDKGREMYAFYLIYNDRLYLDEMFPLKKYKFENNEFLGPQNADALLSRCYGDYMKLPPVEKRHPHYSNVDFL